VSVCPEPHSRHAVASGVPDADIHARARRELRDEELEALLAELARRN
jgi:hypothetical protein